MGRIKKAAGPKHEATMSSDLSEFVSTAIGLQLGLLPSFLRSFPAQWPFPRGDLYHWIPLLDQFDFILEQFIHEYELGKGPQTQPFGRRLLENGVAEVSELSIKAMTAEELNALGFGPDGDREVVETVLTFSKMLLESCGNRSLYSSSERLGDLLNTTSPSLLLITLRLAIRLAQRYHASRQRDVNASQNFNSALLASHYRIDLDSVQRLADSFVKTGRPITPGATHIPVSTLGTKSKEKTTSEVDEPRKQRAARQGNDMAALARDFDDMSSDTKDNKLSDEWGDLWFTYYQPPVVQEAAGEEKKPRDLAADIGSSIIPPTPTPARRPSGLSRPSRLSTSEESANLPNGGPAAKSEHQTSGGVRTVLIPQTKIASTALEDILKTSLLDIPKEFHYEFLSRLRVAQAMSLGVKARQQILAIRILAITNLTYIYPESTFQQKILQSDSDEPRRLQLAYQLADLIHPQANGQSRVPLYLKTVALGALEALSKHKSRGSDVCTALNVNLNHGVLLYVLRKAAADLAVDEQQATGVETDEWNEALFSLLEALPTAAPRTSESLIGAGLFEILIEVLTLRTAKAERAHPKVLMFMNSIMYTVRDAFQTFTNSKGLDVLADLIAWEVLSSLERVRAGNGLSDRFKTQVMDYKMPYFQQQTVRWLFKFVNHMMQHGNANFDRLLRNLIDSPHLLNGLREVIMNAKVFGSNIWSGAVTILSSFIHNEPTSYAVIAEAGLSKALLEAISSKPIPDTPVQPPASDESSISWIEKTDSPDVITFTADKDWVESPDPKPTIKLSREKGYTLAVGILPATDSIVTIPQAFGAICLNTAGLELFLSSGALESFFEIFENPDHIKSMSAEIDLPRLLGASFDELVRHHPRLKSAVIYAMIVMLGRVGYLCKSRTWEKGAGAKLWVEGEDGKPIVSGGQEFLAGHFSKKSIHDEDVDMDGISDLTPPEKTKEIREHSSDYQGPSVSTYVNVVSKFLTGFLENSSLCAPFVEAGGIEFVIDLAILPSLPYDFNSQHESQEIARVIHMLVEQKPHLVLPSVMHHALRTLDILEPFTSYVGKTTFFAPFAGQESEGSGKQAEKAAHPSINGTAIIKALVKIHTLCNVLKECFSQPVYTARGSQVLFCQVNLADMYVNLVKGLGRLHQVCIWEEIILQNSIPNKLRDATKIKGHGMGSNESDELLALLSNGSPEASRDSSTRTEEATGSTAADKGPNSTPGSAGASAPAESKLENTARFKNVQSIRYLLSQIPSSIIPFIQGLGRSLVPKRRPESYVRQNAYLVANAIATAMIDQLHYDPPHEAVNVQRSAYYIVALNSISRLMIDNPLDRPHPQCLTLVLECFKTKGGLRAINALLELFFEKASSLPKTKQPDFPALTSVYGAMKVILTFYTQITNPKYIIDSSQAQGMTITERDRQHPHFFSPNQLLVELRMLVLPVVRSIWDSSFVDNASSSIVKCLINIIRTALDSEHEGGAFKRSDKIIVRSQPQIKPFVINSDREKDLKDRPFDPILAREALYRCFNNKDAAEEYCQSHVLFDRNIRLPIPSYDKEKERTPSPPKKISRRDSGTTITEDSDLSSASQPSVNGPDSTAEGSHIEGEGSNQSQATNAPVAPEADDGAHMAMSIDNILNLEDVHIPTPDLPASVESVLSRDVSTPVPETKDEVSKPHDYFTIDDLEDERVAIRTNLIDRALDVLNVHEDITFELSDLITTAAAKAPDAATMRKEIGETLVQSLISFQDGEDFRPMGKKIAAYANLLAIVLQEREFYDATLDELKDNFSHLLGFIKVFPEQTADELSPWVGQILLVIEKLLAEDVQPQQIKWTPPNSDEPPGDDPIVEMTEPLVPLEEKLQLFETLADILPKVKKDESMATSIIRILVILTRNREIANQLGEKRNLQRLFVMAKQLSGVSNERFQSSFMLVLRHIIEDDDTIRQIMRSEIVANFEVRPSRPTDTTGYVRHMYHLVLRSPSIFVEVTNEKLKLQKFDPTQRPQVLTLKTETIPPLPTHTTGDVLGEFLEFLGDPSAASKTAVQPSTEDVADRANSEEKLKTQEVKAPVVEHPDGIIHYLLSQLLSYKDVEDKDSELTAKDLDPPTPTDVEMSNTIMPPPPPPVEAETDKKSDKPEFKADQHPIYIYRCFLLQCLTELLSSYTRAKIEFINFSRKADPKAMTPSKPRSGVLNYLLNVLIPIGTLERGESISFRKRIQTSNWAIATVVALCVKTGEKGLPNRRGIVPKEEPDGDLLFVRKFVLEHALKAFKDAHVSTEVLDVKYTRLLCLADLFSRLLVGRIMHSPQTHPNDSSSVAENEIAKVMFEKGFIAALTSSIADIDLNFPNSKRAIKYVLRPLNILTQTAIYLSETSDLSATPGQTDDDEISTASSVSDVDDEREETPDLFRHSTLGMLEPGGEEESSSESSDEDQDMYDDEFDDGLEYEEEMERDGDEVISDEDEEIEDAGHIEGLSGDVGMDVEVVIDGDEDESDEDEEDETDDTEDEDGEDIEIIDDGIDDDGNDSLDDGNEDEWQDEVEDGQEMEHESEELNHARGSVVRELMTMQNIGAGLAAFDGLEAGEFGALDMGDERGRYLEELVDADDDDGDDDDDDDVDDEDVIYEPGYEDDEGGMPDPPWGWDAEDEIVPVTTRAHHNHHARRIPSPWSFNPPPVDRGMIVPAYRSHRGTALPRGADDGVNPLLQRSVATRSIPGTPRAGRLGIPDLPASMSDWVHAIDPRRQHEGAVSFINSIVSAASQSGHGFATIDGQNGALHFHIGGNGPPFQIPRDLQVLLGGRRPMPEPARTPRDDPSHATSFVPAPTATRWQEEARLLYGTNYNEKTQRVVNSLLSILVPPALEEEKIRKQKEAELAAKTKELQKQEARLQEERLRKEKEEKEVQEQMERAEREEREASERAAAENQAAADQERAVNEASANVGASGETQEEGEAMEGVERTDPEVPETLPTENTEVHDEAGPSEPAERIRATFRGREVDITDLGIDLEYLNALPDELREEVLMSRLAEQRSQVGATGTEVTDNSPEFREFLEALPTEIREELLQQEASNHRRREREENRRRAAASGGPAARAEDMDPASFLASLDPHLRNAVLLEQDEEVLAHLPEAIRREAQNLVGDRPMHRWTDRLARVPNPRTPTERQTETITKKTPRRPIVQMLDKAGVATLLRLLFVPQQGSSRQSLNQILHHVSQNRQNRAEIVNILLSILQDGSADASAVERSFLQLSLRAKHPATQKTPQPPKRTLTGPLSTPPIAEMTPLMVIQQCLSALVHLTELNPHIPLFFLTEHEPSGGMRLKAFKKGKGKETRAAKFAVNGLLSLLDRKLIMESGGCMEQLSTLLQSVTHPLTMLLRKEKDKPVQAKNDEGGEPASTASAQEEARVGSGALNPAGDEGPGTGIENVGPVEEDVNMDDRSPTLLVAQPSTTNSSADINTAATRPVLAPTSEVVSTDAPGEAKLEGTQEPESEESSKKPRALTAPIVPEENLRLVVNILAARECSAKPFRDALGTINNLSAIPGAKAVFGRELIKQAQGLGETISGDLDALVAQILKAETETDVQGMALTKFSPSSSDQAKLLRVLTALNYLFDPSRNGGRNRLVLEASSSDEEAKEDLLSTAYDNATFGSLWDKLSECLTCISKRDNMINVATILLPLVEALMVVCKNTTLKEAPIMKPAKEFSVTSPPPESRMENLFFRFTEDHRKILNDLVRHNPRLMSGTFSLLVNNPKVLEFDNKRNYFTRRLHSRTEARQSQPPLQLTVRRDQVFLDSFRSLLFKSPDEMKFGKLSIRFTGEEGVDAGGVTREWFQAMSRQMFNGDYALFIPVASDRTTFHPSTLSYINEEHLRYFKVVGRIIGKALYEGRALDCHFSRAVYKRILGKPVSIKDMETLDLDYYKSLVWMLENDIADIITETFSIETDVFGNTEIVDLVENGRNIPVTEENKQEYVQLVVEHRLTGSVKTQLEEFLKGFHDIVPAELIGIFNEQELELLISGLPDIDIDDWKANTEYHNYTAASAQIQWFWRAVRSFDKEERAKLLQFVTGTSKVPLNGFRELEGMNGFSRFNIHRDYGNKDRLPSSHTCFNQLDLPEYESYEVLRKQVYTAMTAGSEYFGFA